MGKMRKRHGRNGENDGNMEGAPMGLDDISREMTIPFKKMGAFKQEKYEFNQEIGWPHEVGEHNSHFTMVYGIYNELVTGAN